MEVYVPMHTEPEDDGTFQSLRWGKLRFRKEGWANGNKWKLPSGLAPVDDIIWLKKTTLSVVDHYEEQKQHSHTATDLTEPTVDIAQVGEDRVERLMKAIIKLHPNLAMDIPEQEELYLAYHKCKSLQPAAVSEGEKCKECKFWIDGCFKDTDSADCFQYSMFQSLNQKGEGWIRVEDRLLEFAEWIYNNGPRGKWAYSEKELVKRFLETHPLPPNPEGGKDED